MQNLVLTQLSITEVRELFRQELKQFFDDHSLQTQEQNPAQKIVDLDGLLKARPFIGSKSTIYKKVAAGEMPHAKNGKRLFFDLDEIDEWLMSNKVETVAELEQKTFDHLNRKRKRVG